jgi:hypothetical protein
MVARLERQQTVLDLLKNLKGLEPLKKLFWSELNYQRINKPLSRGGWSDTAANALAEDPLLFAGGGPSNDFHIIYAHLASDKLLLGQERPVVSRLLNSHPYTLFIFSNSMQDRWHFLNVKYDEETSKRRLFRRITVGPEERLRTASERLEMLDLGSINRDMFGLSPLAIQDRHDEAFDVEKVTKDFFKVFAELYHKVADDISEVPGLEKESGKLAQLLLDRMLFLYFIQKKGWLDGKADYLYSRFEQCFRKDPKGCSYYSDVLYPLFLCLSDADVCMESVGAVSFLNGGLFEEGTRQTQAERLQQAQLQVTNTTFKAIFDELLERFNFTVTEDTPLDVEVAIDPEMLGKIFESLILQLEKDPEKDLRKLTGSYYTPRTIVHFMCQEALKEYLATQLAGEDKNTAEAARERVSQWLALPPADQLDDEQMKTLRELFTETEAKMLMQAIKDCRVCDPAVGSGAFPVGMLHEMVAAIARLDLVLHGKDIIKQRNYDYDLKKQIIESCLYGVDIQEQAVRLCELRLWLSLVVDYQIDTSRPFSGAIREVPSLPNLSYRIVRGDSLLERLFGHVVQLDQMAKDAKTRQLIESIQADKQSYFREGNTAEKRRLELKILAKQADLAERLIEAKRDALMARGYKTSMLGEEVLTAKDRKAREDFGAQIQEFDDLRVRVSKARAELERFAQQKGIANSGDPDTLRRRYLQTGDAPTFMWHVDFAEVFAKRGGFDVVIGNPPYGADIDMISEVLQKHFPETTRKFKDIYKVFFDLGLNKLLGVDGHLVFITPNTFLYEPRYEDLRTVLLQHTLQLIVDLGHGVFEEQVVPTSITVIGINNKKNNLLRFCDLSYTKSLDEKCLLLSEKAGQLIPQEHYITGTDHIFVPRVVQATESDIPLSAIMDLFDCGVKHQRISVGMRQKGNSDLRDRLYTTKPAKDTIELFTGSDLSRFGYYLAPRGSLYLRRNFKDLLENNEIVYFKKEIFDVPKKLVWRQTSDHFVGAIMGESWFANTLQAGVIKKEYKDAVSLEYLLGILNSIYLYHRYLEKVRELGRIFPQVKLGKLKLLPIRIAESDIYKQLEDEVIKVLKLATQVGHTQDDFIEKSKPNRHAIDEIVFEIYEVKESDKMQIQKSLRYNKGD